MKVIISILFFIYALNIYAQKEDINWTLSDSILLNFNLGSPTVSINIAKIYGLGISCISDKNGNLLFYGETNNVYNKNNQIIYSKPTDWHTRFRTIIIPKPESDTIYYMFLLNAQMGTQETPYKYRLTRLTIYIDNTGLAYLEDNTIMEEKTGENLSFLLAMRNANNKNYWLLSADSYSNIIKAYSITSSGISLYTTSLLNKNLDYSELNQLKISPDMRHIAYIRNTGNISYLEFLTFNSQNGRVKNDISIELPTDNGSNIHFEFSPDAEKIFLSYKKPGVRDTLLIKQYNFNLIQNQQAFLNSELLVYKDTLSLNQRITDMQIGYDVRIYTLHNDKYLGIIENPNATPPLCTYNPQGISLKGKKASRHFPHFIRYHTSFSYQFACNTVNYIYYGNQPQSVLWNFDDSQTSTELNPTHTYTNAGTYTVVLQVTYNDNTTKTISKQITIYDKPTQPTILHD